MAPVDGENTTISVRVENDGTDPAGAFVVRVDLDGELLERQTVTLLNDGSEIALDFDWTALAGAHTVRVILDEYDAVAELDETDNEASLSLPHISDATPPAIDALSPADQAKVHGVVTLSVSVQDTNQR